MDDPTSAGYTSAAAVFGGNSPTGDVSSSGFELDPHAVSQAEALSYYAGLPSKPTLVYRTGRPWFPPRGPEAQRRRKELRPVFGHPLVDLWSDPVGMQVVHVLDTHKILFTTIDVVRFRMVETDDPVADDEQDGRDGERAVGPVTIWIGVFPDTTRPSVAHKAAQDVLALLSRYHIADVDVDFRESMYVLEAGPRLHSPVRDLDPLVDVISPLTPALGLGISTTARPTVQGTMGLYLDEGDGDHSLLCLTCRHVLLSSSQVNVNYIRRAHAQPKNVILLGDTAYTNLVESVRLKLDIHAIAIEHWRAQIEDYMKMEKGCEGSEVAKAIRERVRTQALMDDAEEAMKELVRLLHELETHWKKPDARILGPILRSPAVAWGVGDQRFTEDWGIFRIDRAKLGEGFRGNKIDLGTKLSAAEFTLKCFPRKVAERNFVYPKDRLLPLRGTLTDQQMRHPDMLDTDGEPCLLVVKNGNATGTTLGRANGVFSIVREYFIGDMSVSKTSMEWAILGYDGESEAFSEPGDSGAIVADIYGRIGGLLTGGASRTGPSDVTYVTPFWWLLPRIRANGFPHASVDVN